MLLGIGTLRKSCGFTLVILLLLLLRPLSSSSAQSSSSFGITPANEHHVAALNSNMPYVAGFHVVADDLSLRENTNATEITVSFTSTQPEYFPSDGWLGGGMFVQAQDHAFRNVDYGFYMMVVLDSLANLFVDLGLHQTEEGTLPLQMPMSNVVYAYTWLISGIPISTPITLHQSWKNDSLVDYSVSISGQTETLATVNVTQMRGCQNIIPKFYAGNVVIDPFPFSRYINYFQFGVISNQPIINPNWQVDLKEPKILEQTGWKLVEKAWSLQGDHSYLDHDLMWGGNMYQGVNAQYYQQNLQNPYEIIFHYDGVTLAPGRALWDVSINDNRNASSFASEKQDLTVLARRYFPMILALLGAILVLPFVIAKRMKCGKSHSNRPWTKIAYSYDRRRQASSRLNCENQLTSKT